LLREFPPVGAILFARTIGAPPELARLIADLRRALPDGAAIVVDQEGGRVARLRPPHWTAHPPAAELGKLFERRPAAAIRAAWLSGILIGLDCAQAGFDVAAAPVLDLAIPGAHDIIGDRAFAQDPRTIARLARAVASGLLAAGVQPVGKHAPGHGRARVDSHLALPRVDANDLDADILPFALNGDLPWMMTAHIVYPAFDPLSPITLSSTAIANIIRGRIGFKGVLVTDDLAMKALEGSPADLATQALAAGCDIALYCSGDFAPTAALLQRCPPLRPETVQRLRSARAMADHRRVIPDRMALTAERNRLLA
jgi:beta-N-acetylhexosaminidase